MRIESDEGDYTSSNSVFDKKLNVYNSNNNNIVEQLGEWSQISECLEISNNSSFNLNPVDNCKVNEESVVFRPDESVIHADHVKCTETDYKAGTSIESPINFYNGTDIDNKTSFDVGNNFENMEISDVENFEDIYTLPAEKSRIDLTDDKNNFHDFIDITNQNYLHELIYTTNEYSVSGGDTLELNNDRNIGCKQLNNTYENLLTETDDLNPSESYQFDYFSLHHDDSYYYSPPPYLYDIKTPEKKYRYDDADDPNQTIATNENFVCNSLEDNFEVISVNKTNAYIPDNYDESEAYQAETYRNNGNACAPDSNYDRSGADQVDKNNINACMHNVNYDDSVSYQADAHEDNIDTCITMCNYDESVAHQADTYVDNVDACINEYN